MSAVRSSLWGGMVSTRPIHAVWYGLIVSARLRSSSGESPRIASAASGSTAGTAGAAGAVGFVAVGVVGGAAGRGAGGAGGGNVEPPRGGA